MVPGGLDRKVINNSFYQDNFPVFLRSNGPYEVYDHARTKGEREVSKMGKINKLAQDRFNEEVEKLKTLKQTEKKEFMDEIERREDVELQKKRLNKFRSVVTQDFVYNQIEENQERKREFDLREKLYYKPHFGPEETESTYEREQERRHN
jgi:hypothetical protein